MGSERESQGWGQVRFDCPFARGMRSRNAMIRAANGDGAVVTLQNAHVRWQGWTLAVMPPGRTGGAYLAP